MPAGAGPTLYVVETMNGLPAGVLLAMLVLPAQALEISEATVNRGVASKFPKELAGVTIREPKVTLRDGDALFCALARPKLISHEVDFCASLVPRWRQETGSLHGTAMALQSVSAPGIPERYLDLARTLINQAVLPGLDGIEVYQADSWIGRRISDIRVMPGKVDLAF